MSGSPVKCAPTTARWTGGVGRSAIRGSRSSVPAGPSGITPNGSPATSPAGTATAHSPNRLVEWVNRPSRAFAPSGSAATSARLG